MNNSQREKGGFTKMEKDANDMEAIRHYIYNVKRFSKKEDWDVGYNLWGALSQDQRDLLTDIRGKSRGPRETYDNQEKKANGKPPPINVPSFAYLTLFLLVASAKSFPFNPFVDSG